jgi:hypothetical protein
MGDRGLLHPDVSGEAGNRAGLAAQPDEDEQANGTLLRRPFN